MYIYISFSIYTSSLKIKQYHLFKGRGNKRCNSRHQNRSCIFRHDQINQLSGGFYRRRVWRHTGTWQNYKGTGSGDRFQPLGMKGHKKLQDIFTDKKIPKRDRSNIPIITCDETIVWIPGYSIANGWKVNGLKDSSVHLRLTIN